jgi:hypothetical protein
MITCTAAVWFGSRENNYVILLILKKTTKNVPQVGYCRVGI